MTCASQMCKGSGARAARRPLFAIAIAIGLPLIHNTTRLS